MNARLQKLIRRCGYAELRRCYKRGGWELISHSNESDWFMSTMAMLMYLGGRRNFNIRGRSCYWIMREMERHYARVDAERQGGVA